MPLTSQHATIHTTSEQEKTWLQQDGESTLWFNRFKRYRELGPKRSLQAAVEQEHSQVSALKSTNAPKKAQKKLPKAAKNGHLAEVPKTQVPGSWKQASIKWSWQERARAYDSYLIDRTLDRYNAGFFAEMDSYCLPTDRVSALRALLKAMLDTKLDRMSYNETCAWMARMQSILRDIREEMKLMESDFVQMMMRKRLEHWQKNGEMIFAPKDNTEGTKSQKMGQK